MRKFIRRVNVYLFILVVYLRGWSVVVVVKTKIFFLIKYILIFVFKYTFYNFSIQNVFNFFMKNDILRITGYVLFHIIFCYNFMKYNIL